MSPDVSQDFEKLLEESHAEEAREAELRKTTMDAPSFDMPKKAPEVKEEDADGFVTAVEALLVAIAPKRADHQPFTDRCVACERRGVHNNTRTRCDCPCHRVRAFLE